MIASFQHSFKDVKHIIRLFFRESKKKDAAFPISAMLAIGSGMIYDKAEAAGRNAAVKSRSRRRKVVVEMTDVVAALIWEKDRFMICQRPAHKARGMLWEFVGGKVEPGETKEQALVRECREELAVTVSVGDVFMELVHAYPDLTVRLTLFHASIAEGEPQLLEHNDIRWISVAEIKDYAFCPADEEILVKLSEVYGRK